MERISDQFVELFESTAHGVIATLNPDGSPQQSVVWVDHDGDRILVNTARGRRKVKNVERDPRVDVLVTDPDDPGRYVEVRGECVAITEEGADEHDDKLWRRYKDRGKPEGLHADLTRVILEIEPRRVVERSPD
ncbi:PPOX class F420-dependent oxidoreductase [Halorientalis halophila]|uniref:PPOX class F420-dependent oxidoreductase n=1 Tax=Halorientalis halophila TaxID=3108499 RepID=UPI00300AFCD1